MVWESGILVDVQEVVAIDGGYEDAVATLLNSIGICVLVFKARCIGMIVPAAEFY